MKPAGVEHEIFDFAAPERLQHRHQISRQWFSPGGAPLVEDHRQILLRSGLGVDLLLLIGGQPGQKLLDAAARTAHHGGRSADRLAGSERPGPLAELAIHHAAGEVEEITEPADLQLPRAEGDQRRPPGHAGAGILKCHLREISPHRHRTLLAETEHPDAESAPRPLHAQLFDTAGLVPPLRAPVGAPAVDAVTLHAVIRLERRKQSEREAREHLHGHNIAAGVGERGVDFDPGAARQLAHGLLQLKSAPVVEVQNRFALLLPEAVEAELVDAAGVAHGAAGGKVIPIRIAGDFELHRTLRLDRQSVPIPREGVAAAADGVVEEFAMLRNLLLHPRRHQRKTDLPLFAEKHRRHVAECDAADLFKDFHSLSGLPVPRPRIRPECVRRVSYHRSKHFSTTRKELPAEKTGQAVSRADGICGEPPPDGSGPHGCRSRSC